MYFYGFNLSVYGIISLFIHRMWRIECECWNATHKTLQFAISSERKLHMKFVNDNLRMFCSKHAIEMRNGKCNSIAHFTAHNMIVIVCSFHSSINIYPDKVVYGNCITFGRMCSLFSSNVCFRRRNAIAYCWYIMKLTNDWETK